MTVRVGVIGTGVMGAHHVATLHGQVSGAEVVAVADALALIGAPAVGIRAAPDRRLDHHAARDGRDPPPVRDALSGRALTSPG